MNDPGLDEPISKTSQKIDGHVDSDEDDKVEEQAFLNPR